VSDPASRPCTLDAWNRYEGELRGWLVHRVGGDEALAADLLQTVFLKALRQGPRFCEVERPRAWLFTTARHAVVDHFRTLKLEVPVPESLSEVIEPRPVVDSLAACLPRALGEMPEQDADILRRCDLEGMTQPSTRALTGSLCREPSPGSSARVAGSRSTSRGCVRSGATRTAGCAASCRARV
jgi:RNA polymerase sigma-70 factor (ECF subfamily)